MSDPRRVVLATRNDHKVVELREILGDVCAELGLQIVGASEWADAPDVVEDEVTFEGNARLKAQALARHTGLPALADDSGLAVDALHGMPGVFSARWAGKHGDDRTNLELVLGQLADVEERGAQFVCVAALVIPGATSASPAGREWTVTGVMHGALTREPRGTNGFGYDPIFVPVGMETTTAELSPQAKNEISHRGRAFRALARVIAAQI